MKPARTMSLGLILFAAVATAGCGEDSDSGDEPAVTGGTAGFGGSVQTGGAGGAGGSSQTGGAGGAGGSDETGGATGSGGSDETGGAGGASGADETGGAGGAGGSSQTGGATGSGGSDETGGAGGAGGSSQTGGAGGAGGAATGTLCERMCDQELAQNCTDPVERGTCISSCSLMSSSLDLCETEMDEFLECIISQPDSSFECDETGHAELMTDACNTASAALDSCSTENYTYECETTVEYYTEDELCNGVADCEDGSDEADCPDPAPDDEMREECERVGGTVETVLCCADTAERGNFPDMCLVGACGCSPDNSIDIEVCACPEGQCWDGSQATCIDGP